MQPQAQTMATTSAAIAMMACRKPPKATIITASTPRNERSVASDIELWLDCISSYSMIGNPVSPIFTSGYFGPTSATNCCRASIDSWFWAKLCRSSSFSRSRMKPIRPLSEISRVGADSSAAETENVMSGQGDL